MIRLWIGEQARDLSKWTRFLGHSMNETTNVINYSEPKATLNTVDSILCPMPLPFQIVVHQVNHYACCQRKNVSEMR